eukprot:7080237-Pyramimonas_sp.AAC.1
MSTGPLGAAVRHRTPSANCRQRDWPCRSSTAQQNEALQPGRRGTSSELRKFLMQRTSSLHRGHHEHLTNFTHDYSSYPAA